MFCSQCGKEVSDTSKFCYSCGNRIAINPKIETSINSDKSYSNTKTIQKKTFSQAIKSYLIFVILIISFLIFTYLFFHYIGQKYKSDDIKSSVQVINPKSPIESVVPKSQVQTAVPKPSSDWVECYKNEDGYVFSYKIENVENKKVKNIFQVWVKTFYSDRGRDKVTQFRRNSGLSTEGWGKLSEEKWLYEIDCKKHGFNKLSFDYYDTDGKIFYSKVYNEPEWGNIIPNSILDISQKEVCE